MPFGTERQGNNSTQSTGSEEAETKGGPRRDGGSRSERGREMQKSSKLALY